MRRSANCATKAFSSQVNVIKLPEHRTRFVGTWVRFSSKAKEVRAFFAGLGWDGHHEKVVFTLVLMHNLVLFHVRERSLNTGC